MLELSIIDVSISGYAAIYLLRNLSILLKRKLKGIKTSRLPSLSDEEIIQELNELPRYKKMLIFTDILWLITGFAYYPIYFILLFITFFIIPSLLKKEVDTKKVMKISNVNLFAVIVLISIIIFQITFGKINLQYLVDLIQ